MEELVQSLQASTQTIEGVEMVPLSTALQALQAASTSAVLESLQQALAGLNLPLEEYLPDSLDE